MEKLIEGYRIFRETYFQRHREMFEELAQGKADVPTAIGMLD